MLTSGYRRVNIHSLLSNEPMVNGYHAEYRWPVQRAEVGVFSPDPLVGVHGADPTCRSRTQGSLRRIKTEMQQLQKAGRRVHLYLSVSHQDQMGRYGYLLVSSDTLYQSRRAGTTARLNRFAPNCKSHPRDLHLGFGRVRTPSEGRARNL